MTKTQHRHHGLPDRKISLNELETIEAESSAILHTLPKEPPLDTTANNVECIMIVTTETVAALGFTGDQWEILEKTDRPENSFTGLVVTTNDYERGNVQKIEAAMDEFEPGQQQQQHPTNPN